MNFWLTIFVAIFFITVFFGLMAVRSIFLKKGQFRGTCASQSPFASKEGDCSYCGKSAEDKCPN